MNYAVTYQSVVVFSGAIFDFDFNGVADNVDLITAKLKIKQKFSMPLVLSLYLYSCSTNPTVGAIPTHFYQILLRCDGTFDADGVCQGNPYVLSFILPHIARPRNYCEVIIIVLVLYPRCSRWLFHSFLLFVSRRQLNTCTKIPVEFVTSNC